MRESSFELASKLRSQAEALEELFLEGESQPSFQSRMEEEGRLEDLLNLAQDRLATLRLEALQEALEDVESVVRGLREDEAGRKAEGRPLQLIQGFIRIAEAERVRLHHIIDAAVRAEEDSRQLRRAAPSAEAYYSQERGPVRREGPPEGLRAEPKRPSGAGPQGGMESRRAEREAQSRPRKPVREMLSELSDLDTA
jgi:hypothetical protein